MASLISSQIETIESLRILIQSLADHPESVNDKIEFYKIVDLLIKIDLTHSLNCSLEWLKLKNCIENNKVNTLF